MATFKLTDFISKEEIAESDLKMARQMLGSVADGLKGISGVASVLGEKYKTSLASLLTLEPGDYIQEQGRVTAASIAYDLWYLNFHDNIMRKYQSDDTDDKSYFDYMPYLQANLAFFYDSMPHLRPLKVLLDIDSQLVNTPAFGFSWEQKNNWANNGVWWINTMAFEFFKEGADVKYPSDGSPGYKRNPNWYVGYLSIPIGQLGVMEVVSLVQETELAGYNFTRNETENDIDKYRIRPYNAALEEENLVDFEEPPQMFPCTANWVGDNVAGKNYCYGRKLIVSAYRVLDECVTSAKLEDGASPLQNIKNSKGTAAVQPLPVADVELWANGHEKDYEVGAKKWMRYWIHRDSTLPVPGEFIGIIVRVLSVPPHVWWFQNSNPLIYAGNWVETEHLTSGYVTEVILEDARLAGGYAEGDGNLYKVKVQGHEITATASDYRRYAVNDRVAILKRPSVTPDEPSYAPIEGFRWNTQTYLKADGVYEMTDYVIIPATYYKLKN